MRGQIGLLETGMVLVWMADTEPTEPYRQEYRPNPTYGRNPRDSRGESGAHAAASRSTVDPAHPGSHRPAPWVPRVSRTQGRGRLTAGPHAAATRRGRREAACPRPDGRRRRPPARRSGGREREGKGERRRQSTAHPGATAATEEAAGAEGGGGAARVDGVDGVDGVPAVGDRNGEVDEVGEDAANPKEAAPRWEAVRGDDGGGPELGGDGGEKERRRELESGEKEGRREAETDGGALGAGGGGGSGGRKGMTGGPHPSARVADGPARLRRARGEGGRMGRGGEEGEGGRDGPGRPKGGKGDF
uniref:Pr1-like protein n=1 Tax=Oryza sativa subsp. japonica TaxID=39947 RepID=Q850V5_ORYSJ|nr:hypothetical protein [Oryza sativa Japonica Group]